MVRCWTYRRSGQRRSWSQVGWDRWGYFYWTGCKQIIWNFYKTLKYNKQMDINKWISKKNIEGSMHSPTFHLFFFEIPSIYILFNVLCLVELIFNVRRCQEMPHSVLLTNLSHKSMILNGAYSRHIRILNICLILFENARRISTV